jgi:hypothetical protein
MIFDGPIHKTSVCRIEFSWKMVSVLDRAVHLGVAVLLCLASATANAGESRALHMLFVGNSLTYQNDLPRLFAGLAKSRGHDVQVDIYAPGGYRLAQHATDKRLLEKIDGGGWDVVVLQEQSQMPAVPQERLEHEVYPFAQALSQHIRATSPRVRLAFYQTMARRNGDAQNFPDLPEAHTYEGMQRRINASYAEMAKANHGLLVPVGATWEKARKQNPALALYADDVHPSLIGTYLAACVFYAAIFSESPVGAAHPPELDDATATLLQKLANAY